MCMIQIPYFKELIVMAFSCDHCGAKSREVKTGGSTAEKGKFIELKVNSPDDLRRDCFKSETAVFKIPELELELGLGALGGIYSTVEGVVRKVRENLADNNPFGDSDLSFATKIKEVMNTLEEYADGKKNFTFVLDDPLSNSFIQNPNYPSEDKNVKVLVYDRTFDQNEELGLNDIKTEEYQ